MPELFVAYPFLGFLGIGLLAILINILWGFASHQDSLKQRLLSSAAGTLIFCTFVFFVLPLDLYPGYLSVFLGPILLLVVYGCIFTYFYAVQRKSKEFFVSLLVFTILWSVFAGQRISIIVCTFLVAIPAILISYLLSLLRKEDTVLQRLASTAVPFFAVTTFFLIKGNAFYPVSSMEYFGGFAVLSLYAAVFVAVYVLKFNFKDFFISLGFFLLSWFLLISVLARWLVGAGPVRQAVFLSIVLFLSLALGLLGAYRRDLWGMFFKKMAARFLFKKGKGA